MTMSISEITQAAHEGDVLGMLALAECYEAGRGIDRDIVQAAKWYKSAADGGNVRAMRKIADCYYFNKEVENIAEAVKYYRKAAKAGEAKAMYNLGVFYEQGKHVPEDIETAFKYYLAAAEAGRHEGDYKAGVMYIYGKGTKPNPEKGFELLSRAAGRDGVSSNALYYLGFCYLSGIGVAADEIKGIAHLERAAREKNGLALTALGDIYLGKNFKQKAREYYIRAAEMDEPQSLVRLANMAYAGDGVETDKETAFELYERAAALGDSEAQQKLKDFAEEANKYLKK